MESNVFEMVSSRSASVEEPEENRVVAAAEDDGFPPGPLKFVAGQIWKARLWDEYGG